jgi:hypothetical protein
MPAQSEPVMTGSGSPPVGSGSFFEYGLRYATRAGQEFCNRRQQFIFANRFGKVGVASGPVAAEAVERGRLAAEHDHCGALGGGTGLDALADFVAIDSRH